MNELAMLDKNLSVERTPQLIATEINSIKEQTRKLVLFNSIEIGRRLTEAKSLIEHGEWGEWLDKSVAYSQRTASNLMRIFDEYGSSQITFFCDNAKSQALANLSYTQAVALLGIPTEEREAFIQDHDIDSLSTRELQQAIKDKQELEAKLREIEAGWTGTKKLAEKSKRLAEEKTKEAERLLEEKKQAEAAAEKLRDDLKKEKEKSKKEISRLGLSIEETKRQLEEAQSSGNDDEIKKLQESLDSTEIELANSLSKIAELERQLKEPLEVTAAPVVEKVPEEIERELNELRERNKELEAKEAQPQPVNTASVKFKVHFDSLVDEFKNILSVIDEMTPEEQRKYQSAVKGLIGKMSERL